MAEQELKVCLYPLGLRYLWVKNASTKWAIAIGRANPAIHVTTNIIWEWANISIGNGLTHAIGRITFKSLT